MGMGMLEKIAKDLEELKEKVDKLPATVGQPSPEMESKFKDKEGLKLEEVADYLGVSKSSIARHQEQLPHVYLGNRLIFSKSLLKEWMIEEAMDNMEVKEIKNNQIEREDFILKELS
jgi:excisionase family DNA binding protein